ncbi:MAG TPA: helix-turn-helix domain-containing protein [Firmicutes bacterium]|jgi:Uma2 family endonuclease/predicted DNA-binding transcriptional regulator AlpA|nr:helix-turn-helix domain-containing protein [Bacillota bacterium]
MVKKSGLVTAHDLARELGLSVETIWRYTRQKAIPFIELGPRQYRYRLEEVLAALAGGKVREEESGFEEEPEKKYTYQDYLKMPEEPGYRFEIIEGMLIREPSPNVMHQRVSRRLMRILEDYFWETDSRGEVFGAPLDTTFGDMTVVQPDLFYVSAEQEDIIKETRIDGAPTLVVEIISPSSRRKDRLQKMQLYQKAAVKHYWIVDPEEKTLECFALQGSLYSLVACGMERDMVEHPNFKGLSLDLSRLWP